MSDLPVLPQTVRTRTALTCRAELDLPGGTVRVSSRDLYDASGLVEGLLQSSPDIALGDRYSPVGELPTTDELTLTLWNESRRFTSAFQVDPRESLVRVYLYDPANPADEELVFVGQIEKPHFSDAGLATVTLTCGAIRKSLDAPFLMHPVTADLFPAIQPEPVETGGEGSQLADGFGTGLHLPLIFLRGPTFEDPRPIYEFGALGACEIEDVRTTATQPPYIPDLDYAIDCAQTYPNAAARAMTVLRFEQDVPPSGLTATLTRNHRDVDADDLALWLFSGLRDAISDLAWEPGTLADFGNSDATTGELVAGPSGVGVAAVGAGETVAGYWTCADAGMSQAETFTLEGRLYRPTTAAVGPVLWSAGGAHGGTDSEGGWAVRVAGTGELEFLLDTGGGASIVLASPSAIQTGRWVKFAITRDGGTGAMALRIDDGEVDTATDATAIDYSGGETPMVLGAAVASSAATFWAGGLRLSGLRLSQTARPDTDLDDDYFWMRGSPIIAVKAVLEGAGEVVETTAYEAARATVDAFDDGGLQVGGWVTDGSTVAVVLGQLLKIVAGWISRTAANEIAIGVPSAPTEAVATFGFYPESQWKNAAHISSDLQSTQEATKRLTTLYRLNRTATGGADAPQKRRENEPVLPRGSDQELDLRLVYSHRTAALVAGRERIDRRRRDEQRVIDVQHEGIPALRGTVVRLDLGEELRRGHYDAADYDSADYLTDEILPGEYEVLERILRAGHVKRLTCSPHDPDLYLPQPGTNVPVDELIEARPVLDLGTDPEIRFTVTLGNGDIRDGSDGYALIGQGDRTTPRVSLRLALRSSLILSPLVADPGLVAPGQTINNGTVSGAADRASALAADDAAYVELDDSWTLVETTQACTFDKPGLTLGTITRFDVEARTYYVSGSGDVLVGVGLLEARIARPPSLRWRTLTELTTVSAPTGDYESQTVDLIALRESMNLAPWSLADIRSGTVGASAVGDLRLAVRCAIPSGATVRVGSLRAFLDIEQQTAPARWGGLAWYRKPINLPDGSLNPDRDVPPIVGATPPLGSRSVGLTWDDTPADAAQYNYWCAAFDERGRFARLFGPVLVTLAHA